MTVSPLEVDRLHTRRWGLLHPEHWSPPAVASASRADYARDALVGVDLRPILDQARLLLDADTAAIYVLVHGLEGELALQATVGPGGAGLAGRIDATTGVVARGIRAERPFAVDDTVASSSPLGWSLRRHLHLPLVHDGRLHGLVSAVRHDGRPFLRSEQGRARALATVLSAEFAVRRPVAPRGPSDGGPAMARPAARRSRTTADSGSRGRPGGRSEGATYQLDLNFILQVAHQLRAPLAAIAGAATVLDGNVGDDRQHFVEMIDRNVQRTLRLVSDFVLAADDTTREALPLEIVDVRQILADAVEDAVQGGRIVERCFSMRSGGEALVWGDRDRLSQAFDNLLGNAGAYTPDGGSISATVVGGPRSVEVVLRNSGPGIPVQERLRVFERFYRGEDAVERGIPGSGLGLTVVRNVVETHGGTVEIVGGTGTCVRIVLPRGDREAA